MADQLSDGNIKFKFYGYENKENIDQLYSFTKEYKDRADWDSSVYSPIHKDSVTRPVWTAYEEKGKLYQSLTSERHREAWATPAKLPVLHLSDTLGGLKYQKMGGGHQTINMRLKDSTGHQYVLRSVKKTPHRVIPEQFESKFTQDLVDNFYASQHPYSALMVPPIAKAVDVPHTNPTIGVVSPDSILEHNADRIGGQVYLLEPWEPYQPTDNYRKALKKLLKDNDNQFDDVNFLNARMVDLLVGDWDRDEDQWRFHDTLQSGKHRKYYVVPRDRDMVLNVSKGIAVGIAKRNFLVPHVYGFNSDLLQQVNWYLYASDFLNAEPSFQINYEAWMKEAYKFKERVNDSVLKASVNAMPQELNSIETGRILKILKDRRDQIPETMDKYYKFTNKIVDIHGSKRKEFISIKDLENEEGVHIMMQKFDKHFKLTDTLMEKDYPSSFTKEIRLYLEKNFDSVAIDNSSNIKLRIIGGKPRKGSHKAYNIINSKNKIEIYDYQKERYYGKTNKIKKKISKDKRNTAYEPVDLYPGQNSMHPSMAKEMEDKGTSPWIDANYNLDDGFSFGIGLKYIQYTGFRKNYHIADHELMLKHSTHTAAYGINYKGDFQNVFGKANLLVQADINGPKHVQNFFELGNESVYDQENHIDHYRTRFNLYNLATSVKWDWRDQTLSIGPSIQYYHYNPKKNKGRYTENPNKADEKLNPNANTVSKNRVHLGIKVDYDLDKRNDEMLPTDGFQLKANFKANLGLNSYSHAFTQISPEFSFYKSLNARKSLILNDRIGGSVTTGNPAYYQHAYLGGQGNLLGYRQYRFAGKQSFYNNLNMRLVLADF